LRASDRYRDMKETGIKKDAADKSYVLQLRFPAMAV
jgi:hypothetical protein